MAVCLVRLCARAGSLELPRTRSLLGGPLLGEREAGASAGAGAGGGLERVRASLFLSLCLFLLGGLPERISGRVAGSRGFTWGPPRAPPHTHASTRTPTHTPALAGTRARAPTPNRTGRPDPLNTHCSPQHSTPTSLSVWACPTNTCNPCTNTCKPCTNTCQRCILNRENTNILALVSSSIESHIESATCRGAPQRVS
jgi:hypothetical protein